MAHKFDPQNIKKLDSEQRRAIMPPTETLIRLGLKASDTMADIGSGIGYFTIPAAQMLASANSVTTPAIVYALDTSADMLEEIQARTVSLGLSNIRYSLTEEYDFKLPDASVSFALICNVLHEVDDKPRFLKEASRLLQPGGILAVIEWHKRPTMGGPPQDERIASEALGDYIEQAGLIQIQAFNFTENFYAMTAFRGIAHV